MRDVSRRGAAMSDGTVNPVVQFSPSDRVVSKILLTQAARYGDRPLFSCGGTRWTFSGIIEQVAGFAGRLKDAGIGQGDRVAILCSNRAELMLAFLACGWLGAVSVPINVSSRGFQLQHMLKNSGAKLLIAEGDLLAALDGLSFTELDIKHAWIVGEADAAALDRVPVPCTPFPDAGAPVEPAKIGPDAPLTILYTSGTTGLSKGVICPHAQYFWWGVYTGRQLGIVEGDVLHTPLPLFHTNALNSFFQALLLCVGLLGRDEGIGCNRHLSARRHGAHAALAA
jgi:crotonobetaine/carnitine-CoA ligase